jgi:hypothetical protein
VNSQGAQIGNPAGRSGNPVKTVTIAPKKSAGTMVGFAHTANFPAAKCKPVTARGLRVIPPNQTTSVILKHKFSACSGTSVIFLTVLPSSSAHTLRLRRARPMGAHAQPAGRRGVTFQLNRKADKWLELSFKASAKRRSWCGWRSHG